MEIGDTGGNPFGVYGVESRMVVSPGESYMETDEDTGETRRVVRHRAEKVVSHDPAKYIKLYSGSIGLVAGLTPRGLYMLLYICAVMPPNKTLVYLDRRQAGEFSRYLRGSSYYTAIGDLVSHGIIAKSVHKGAYWINPNVVFNGNRTRLPKK